MKGPLLKITALALIAGLTLIGVHYYLDFRIPRATAIIQVHPSLISTSQHSQSGIISRKYMESEFETPLSQETLTQAAIALGISEDKREEALLSMKKNVTASPLRGADFIKITAKDEDQKQAARVANAIAEAYMQRRLESEISRAKGALEALDNELIAQKELVSSSRQELQNLLKKIGYNFPAEDLSFPKVTELPYHTAEGTIEVTLAQHPYNQAVENFTQARAMLREMKLQQQEARVLLKMPRAPVTIHERAK